MDLHDEFERFSHNRATESGMRLRDAGVRSRLEARVTRGRRVQNAKVGVGTVAAIGAMTAGAVMGPRLGLWTSSPAGNPSPSDGPTVATSPTESQATSSAPAPSASVPADGIPVDAGAMPALGTRDHLASAFKVWTAPGPLACAALASSEPEGGVGEEVAGEAVPLPAWIETGRLYGWGDDVLVGGYPLPLAATGQPDFDTVQALVSDFSTGPAELVLTRPDGTLSGFAVTWSERDDLPHDAPGLYVTLSANYDCNDGVPVEGLYDARLSFEAADGTTQVVSLASITVVDGVPSLPEVDAAGR